MTNFCWGGEGDKIDLQSLLDANFNAGSNIDDFVKLTQDGSNITVSVDTDGAAYGANRVDVGSAMPPVQEVFDNSMRKNLA